MINTLKKIRKRLASIRVPGSLREDQSISKEQWENAMASIEELREIMVLLVSNNIKMYEGLFNSIQQGTNYQAPPGHRSLDRPFSILGRPDFKVARKYAGSYHSLSETASYVNKAESGRLGRADFGDNIYFLGYPDEVFYPVSSLFIEKPEGNRKRKT